MKASDVAEFDPSLTDPTLITPENFSRIVEKRLMRLQSVKGTTTIGVFSGCCLLMGKRKDSGKWTFPGGGLDDGEAPIAGALRELWEEAGIKAGSLVPIEDQIVSGRTGRSVHVYCFKTEVKDRSTSTINDPDNEIEKWEWIDVTNGIPLEIMSNLQTPDNFLLKCLGYQKR